MRLFFSLWPDEGVAHRLQAASGLLQIEGRARFVPVANFHLTLAFIGEVPDEQLGALRDIGRSMQASAFTAVCDALEYWPQARVIVAAVREPSAMLLELSRKLHDAVGLPRAPFRPHVTLVRKLTQAPVLPPMSPIVWRVEQFALVRSETGGAASAYTVLDTWPLLYER